jgi:hypothetical protein
MNSKSQYSKTQYKLPTSWINSKCDFGVNKNIWVVLNLVMSGGIRSRWGEARPGTSEDGADGARRGVARRSWQGSRGSWLRRTSKRRTTIAGKFMESDEGGWLDEEVIWLQRVAAARRKHDHGAARGQVELRQAIQCSDELRKATSGGTNSERRTGADGPTTSFTAASWARRGQGERRAWERGRARAGEEERGLVPFIGRGERGGRRGERKRAADHHAIDGHQWSTIMGRKKGKRGKEEKGTAVSGGEGGRARRSHGAGGRVAARRDVARLRGILAAAAGGWGRRLRVGPVGKGERGENKGAAVGPIGPNGQYD